MTRPKMKFRWWTIPAVLLGGYLWFAIYYAIAFIVSLFSAGPADGDTLVVRVERGGLITERHHQINSMIADGTRVAVRGKCLSACTMFLALGDAVCTGLARALVEANASHLAVRKEAA